MAASRQDIIEWFARGLEDGATHMIVVCDTYDYEDYPVYVLPGQSVREIEDKQRGNMQRVMEVYALHLGLNMQLNEHRAFHYDDAPPTTLIEEEPV